MSWNGKGGAPLKVSSFGRNLAILPFPKISPSLVETGQVRRAALLALHSSEHTAEWPWRSTSTNPFHRAGNRIPERKGFAQGHNVLLTS